MPCPHCQLEPSRCSCQASLLPPVPDWRREMQQRVGAYRARRRGASEGSTTPADGSNRQGAPAAAWPEPSRVVEFPAPAETVLRTTSSVVVAPAAEPFEPWVEPAVRDPGPPERQFERAPVRRQVEPGPTLLQLPLPMAAAAAERAAPMPTAAPRRLRCAAALVDAAVVLAATTAFGAAAAMTGEFSFSAPHALRALLPALVGVPGLLAAVYLLLCGYAGGSTVGMHCCGLQIIGLDGDITAADLRRRAWASLASLAALGMGFAWLLCDRQHLSWHDYMSGTCVVKIREQELE